MAVFTKLNPYNNRTVINQGSMARDHLANERTLLAWVRTSVALLALGIGIAKFSLDEDEASQRSEGFFVGLILVILGCVVIVYSRSRYFEVVESLDSGEYKVNEGGVNFMLAMIVLAAMICLLMVTFKTA